MIGLRSRLLVALLLSASLLRAEPCDSWAEAPPVRAEQVPEGALARSSGCFLEGYIQALVDMHYYEHEVCVRVEGDTVYLSNLPANCLLAESIVAFVCDHPCVQEVVAVEEPCCDSCCVAMCRSGPLWLPQNTVLFQPFIADPRQVTYSIGYRWHDQGVVDAVWAVTMGDQFPLVRYRDVWPWCGDFQIDLEAGVFAIFDAEAESTPLLNADYYVGFPFTYAIGCWSYRFRIWHISTHLGDEFIVLNPHVERKNLSKEGVDFYTSYQMTSAIRYYAGVGWIIHQDEEFERENSYIEYGAEVRPWGCRDVCAHIYGSPFFAVHLRHYYDTYTKDWDANRTFALGWEWSKLSGVGRKVRFYLEYHEGFSLEGQFSRTRTDYLAVKLAYGF